MKPPDPSTAFRLPRTLLATIDAVCQQQDLTRSQLYRKSIADFLKKYNVDMKTKVTSAEPGFFESWLEGTSEAHGVGVTAK